MAARGTDSKMRVCALLAAALCAPAPSGAGESAARARLVEAVAAVSLPAAPNEEADLTRDGKVTLADLAQLSRDLSTLAAAWRGDVNDDLRVDERDLFLLAERLLAAAGEGTGETAVRELLAGSMELSLPDAPSPFPVAATAETPLPAPPADAAPGDTRETE